MTNVLATTPGSLLGLVEFRLEFFLIIFNMLVLFAFMRWKFFGPVSEFMQKRADKIQASLQEAEDKNVEVDQLKASYNEKLSNIKDEELEILKKARIAAEVRTSEMIKGAEQEIEKMKLKAQHDIEQEHEKAIRALKDDIAGLAIMAASKVVDKEIDGAKHVTLIEDVIQRVGDAKWHN